MKKLFKKLLQLGAVVGVGYAIKKIADNEEAVKREIEKAKEDPKQYAKNVQDSANKKVKDQENIINSVITYINNETQIVNEIAQKTVAEILPLDVSEAQNITDTLKDLLHECVTWSNKAKAYFEMSSLNKGNEKIPALSPKQEIDNKINDTKEAIDNAVSLREIQKNQNILNTVTGAVADYLIAKKENNEPLSEAEQHLIDIAKKNVKGKESKKKK